MVLKVLERKAETANTFSLVFEKPKGFSFYAGQYLDYELDGDTRAFTISASPTEEFLMLSTKKGQSEFKKALAHLKTGDEIKTSHPAGTFILDESSPAVFIAGGIGVTPFRSMIKYALDQKLTTSITLFYSNSDEDFVFKKELNAWKQNLPNLNIIYHNSSQSGHLTKLYPIPYPLYPSALARASLIYYLAGPPKMVDSFEKILIQHKVHKTNIRYDNFDGY